MGPAAWMAVGRALGYALVSSLFKGKNNIVAIIAKEIQRAILNNDIETACALLKDLAHRHREQYEIFLKKYANHLPPELVGELKSL
jgi:hypothetical protein